MNEIRNVRGKGGRRRDREERERVKEQKDKPKLLKNVLSLNTTLLPV